MKFDRQAIILITAFLASLAVLVYRSQVSVVPTSPHPSTIEEVDANGLMRAVKELGVSFVFVNFWATWCEPCLEEVPALLALEKKYHDQGVRVLFVSLDEPEEKDDILRFVESHSGMKVFRKSTEGAEIVTEYFNAWQGVIPTTIVFSKSGKVLKQIEGTKNFIEFEKIVKTLVHD